MRAYAQRRATSVPRGGLPESAVKRRTAAPQPLSSHAPAAELGHRFEGELGVDFQRRLERASRLGHNFSRLPVHAPAEQTSAPVQPKQDPSSERRPNRTGMPNQLKAGIESLSGMSLDHVKVHYNSSRPAQLSALAYAQGSDIHVAPGQERHLPHEAWHVVQQAQGRVRPTMQMKGGVSVNDHQGLEHEADVMGARALLPHDPETRSAAATKGTFAQSGGLMAAGSNSGRQEPIQMVCEKCGSPDHKTAKCRQTKQQRDEHADKIKKFNLAKEQTLKDLQEEEHKEDTWKGPTSAFKEKHMKGKGRTLDQSAKKVAKKRDWARGAQSGMSTVIDMNEEQARQEARFQIEGLKFNEGTINPETGGLGANFGVNKPTKFDYFQKTSKVVTGKDGQRKITEGKEQLGKPVLGMQGTDIHHLHGVEELE